MSPQSTAGMLLATFALLAPSFGAAHDGTGSCPGTPPAAVTAAREALDTKPAALEARFRLADALIEANCYNEAVHTLEDGQKLHPGNAALDTKLRNTRSLVSEQTYFAGREQAEQAARVSRNLLRCSRLGDLNACDEALKLKPDDVEILLAKGDALLTAARPADAEVAFRHAKEVAPDNAQAASQLTAAHAQRIAALGDCQNGSGDAALAACQAALLRGADDEFQVHSRLGQLFQQRNQPVAALNSYVAANALKRGDRNVALGIVALTDGNANRDAVTWAARGSALLGLKRGTEALTAFRQAQSLAPGMPDLRAQISQAEALAKSEPGARTAAAAAPGAAAMAMRVAEVPAATRRYSNDAEASRSN